MKQGADSKTSRADDLVVPVAEPVAKAVKRLGPWQRLQYRAFQAGESVGRSHWSRDVRLVVAAAVAFLLVAVALGVMLGGLDVLRSGYGPTEPAPKPQFNP